MVLRGGTSRGVYFRETDLPSDPARRDAVLLSIAGGPDHLQVDGIGGGHPLTNKVAIVDSSDGPDADIDYLFLQISPAEGKVADVQNCGNILAGVGQFAIESGMIEANEDATTVRIHMLNSDSTAEVTVQTPGRDVSYDGDTAIDGVPGTASPVICDFLDVAGSASGALLPTGNSQDEIDGIAVTCIDNGMPVVVLRAADLGIIGSESPEELENNHELTERLEQLRLRAGSAMNLGDVSAKTVPKMCLISSPQDAGLINTRTFIPHTCHRSIGVLGAVSVASACLVPGSVAQDLAVRPMGTEISVAIEHPAGSLGVRLVVVDGTIKKAGVIRTARLIMKGEVLVPFDVWDGA
jgi:4-oxalomesaconate tautomerase